MATDSVSAALKSARYNEVVSLRIDNSSREILLAACLDKKNGGISWNDVSSSDDPHVAIRRHLRTKRWLFPMLNDQRRNQLYEQAIRKACEDIKKRDSNNPCHVLDVGTGTGLLALMAARNLPASSVTTLEMSNAMASLAKVSINSNSNEAQRIEVVEAHSCEISPLPKKSILCTSELLESGLLAEGWIPTMRDAWARHLAPDAIVIPQRATVFACVVEGDEVNKYVGPHVVSSFFEDGHSLRLTLSDSNYDVLTGRNCGVQIPLHGNRILPDVRLLSDPIRVLTVDVSSRERTPDIRGAVSQVKFLPIASGCAHGVLFWWELNLLGDLKYSTKVGSSHWQDHWHQCLCVFPVEEDGPPRLNEGIECTLLCGQTDSRLFFSVRCNHQQEHDETSERSSKRSKVGHINPESTVTVSAERTYQLNDANRLASIRKGLQQALLSKGNDAVVLDLSDFSLCAIVAAELGASHVNSLESSAGELPMTAARVAQIGNGLPKTGKTFQILQCHAENLTLEIIGGKPVQIVACEPYYEVLEGWHLQEALNYFYLLAALRRRNVVETTAACVPGRADIMACMIESTQLATAYTQCKPEICGIRHDVVNDVGCRFHEHDLVLPMWQYDYVELSEEYRIASLDYTGNMMLDVGEWTTVTVSRTGTCHALLVWVEYHFSGIESKMSTKTRSHNQTVRMLKKPEKVSGSIDTVSCRILFDQLDSPDLDHDFEIAINKAASPCASGGE